MVPKTRINEAGLRGGPPDELLKVGKINRVVFDH